MEIIFLPVAKVELADAISYYNSQSGGSVMSLPQRSREPLNESFSNLTLGLNYKDVPTVAEPIASLTESFTRLKKKSCLL
jgi:hypothetical protein